MSGDLTVQQREGMAHDNHELLMRGLAATKTGSLTLASALYVIDKDDLWSELGFDSFSAYLAQPDISLPVATAKRYIELHKAFMQYKLEDYKDISINKLELLKNIKRKDAWFDHARTLGYSDLKKEINEKVKGIKAVDNEVDEHIKKHSNCSYWNGIKCLKDDKGLI